MTKEDITDEFDDCPSTISFRLGEANVPLTEEQEKELRRLSTQTASKLRASELAALTDLQWIKERHETQTLQQQFDGSDAIRELLDANIPAWANEQRARLANVAEPADEELYGTLPTLEELCASLSSKQRRLLAVTDVDHQACIYSACLSTLLDDLRDYWHGRSVQSSEWRVNGEFSGFETIRRLRELRQHIRPIRDAAHQLSEAIVASVQIDSRMVAIHESQLKMREE